MKYKNNSASFRFLVNSCLALFTIRYVRTTLISAHWLKWVWLGPQKFGLCLVFDCYASILLGQSFEAFLSMTQEVPEVKCDIKILCLDI